MAEPLVYRPLQPDDLSALRLLHRELFPLDYDDAFYLRAVHGDGIASWAAVASPPPTTACAVDSGLAPQLHVQQHRAGPSELLAGCITAREFPALLADPHDRRLMGLGSPAWDEERLTYVLTLGVAQAHQRRGIARLLLACVLRQAGEACRAVFLHVAAFNRPALAFYSRAGFSQLAVLPDFYTIRRGSGHAQLPLTAAVAQASHAVNLAVQPLAAVVGSLNACLPWGSDRRRQAAPLPPRARLVEVQSNSEQQQQHVEVQGQAQRQQRGEGEADEQRSTLAAKPFSWADGGGPRPHWHQAACQPEQQQSHGTRPASSPPDWLRGLFARH